MLFELSESGGLADVIHAEPRRMRVTQESTEGGDFVLFWKYIIRASIAHFSAR